MRAFPQDQQKLVAFFFGSDRFAMLFTQDQRLLDLKPWMDFFESMFRFFLGSESACCSHMPWFHQVRLYLPFRQHDYNTPLCRGVG